MARAYDIVARLQSGNERPTVKIDESHEFKINTSKSAVLFIRASTEDKDKDEFEKIDAIIKIALGEDAFEYIMSQDPPMENLSLIVNVIMAAISNEDLETLEAQAGEEKQAGKKSK